jgi:hypothetical protein
MEKFDKAFLITLGILAFGGLLFVEVLELATASYGRAIAVGIVLAGALVQAFIERRRPRLY